MNFWSNNALHQDPEQIKRQKSALNKKLTPIIIDRGKSYCEIKGSGRESYKITTSSCTCSDFTRRKLPCKHMYRLAHYLNLFELPGQVKESSVVPLREADGKTEYLDKSTGEIISTNRNDFLINLDILPDSQQQKLFEVAHTLHFDPEYKFLSFSSEDWKPLVDLKYLSFGELSLDEKLKELGRSDLIGLIEDWNHENIPYNPKSICRTLIKFINENFSDNLDEINQSIVVIQQSPYISNYLALYKRLAELLGIDLIQPEYLDF